MLRGRTRPDREQHVTTRPAARPPDKIRAWLCWALALALRHLVSWSHSRSAGLPRGCLFSTAFAITPTLRTPPFLALRTGPIMLTGLPTPPAPGRSAASFTAVTHLGMARPEPVFTAFQKTVAQSQPRPRPLIGGARRWILRWAQGGCTPEGQASEKSGDSSPRRSSSRLNNSLQLTLLAAIAQPRPAPRLTAKMVKCLAAINIPRPST